MARGTEGPDRTGAAEVPDRVVVWSLGEALLAAALHDVVAVAPVGDDGRAHGREGGVGLVVPPGLPPPASPVQAVILDTARGRVAVPADGVEGVRECGPGSVAPPPPWLQGLAATVLRGLVRLDDRRIAGLLDPDALPPVS